MGGTHQNEEEVEDATLVWEVLDASLTSEEIWDGGMPSFVSAGFYEQKGESEQRTELLERWDDDDRCLLFFERSVMGTDLVSGFGSGGTIGVLQSDQIAWERLAEMMMLAEDMAWAIRGTMARVG